MAILLTGLPEDSCDVFGWAEPEEQEAFAKVAIGGQGRLQGRRAGCVAGDLTGPANALHLTDVSRTGTVVDLSKGSHDGIEVVTVLG